MHALALAAADLCRQWVRFRNAMLGLPNTDLPPNHLIVDERIGRKRFSGLRKGGYSSPKRPGLSSDGIGTSCTT